MVFIWFPCGFAWPLWCTCETSWILQSFCDSMCNFTVKMLNFLLISIKYWVSYCFNPLKLLYTLLVFLYSYTLNFRNDCDHLFHKTKQGFDLKLWKGPSYNVGFCILWILASKCMFFLAVFIIIHCTIFEIYFLNMRRYILIFVQFIIINLLTIEK